MFKTSSILRPLALRAGLFTILALAACGDELAPGAQQGSDGNRSPYIDPVGDRTISEGETLHVVVAVGDPDGDTMYLTAIDLPAGAVFDPVQGTLDWRPGSDTVRAPDDSFTTAPITIRVDDNRLLDETTFTVTVTDVNRPPFFLSTESAQIQVLEAQVEPNTEERVRFQVVDPDGDEVSLQLDGSPVFARLDGEALVLSPTEADSGTAEFTIVADDGADTQELAVTVIVGEVAAEVPAPTGLRQSGIDGPIATGGEVFEGRMTFAADPHALDGRSLRLSVEIAEVGTEFDDGIRSTSDLVIAGEAPFVDVELDGGVSYRWRARYLSDELGPGPYASYGGNADTTADLVVSIVPHTELAAVPHDPSPIDVTFAFYSDNVTRFECSLDDEEYESCGTQDCPASGVDLGTFEPSEVTCRQVSLFGVRPEGDHVFRVRGVTREGIPDPTPAEHTWEVIDLGEPSTDWSVTPPASVGCDVSFRFESNQADVTFECKLERTSAGGRPPECDGSASQPSWCVPVFAECTAPRDYTFASGTNGNYRMSVRATNIVSLTDPTPLQHNFVVDCP